VHPGLQKISPGVVKFDWVFFEEMYPPARIPAASRPQKNYQGWQL
jgi:hypothetical protein